MFVSPIDMVTIGENYLSILYSLGLRAEGREVLLLDENRLGLGNIFSQKIGCIEKMFLETWGKDRNISCLQNLSLYTQEKPIQFIWDNKRLYIGSSPSGNFLEIARKLPQILGDDLIHFLKDAFKNKEDRKHFDKSYFSLCRRVAQNAFRYKNLDQLSTTLFSAHCPENIKAIFSYFFKYSQDWETGKKEELEKSWEFRTFLFMARGFYQNQFSMGGSDGEIFHLLLSLLSPPYVLDHEKLLDHLKEDFAEKGGHIRKSNIREWIFHRGRPWGIELSSFEGVIRPKQLTFFGGVPVGLPIEFSPGGYYYTAYNLEFEMESIAPPGSFIFSSGDRMGTSFPFWEGEIKGNELKVSIAVPLEKGDKFEFQKDKILDLLEGDLVKVIPNFQKNQLNYKKGLSGKEIWSRRGNGMGASRFRAHPKAVSLKDLSVPGKRKKLKDCFYFGPIKEGNLGLFTTLMEIKEASKKTVSKQTN